MAPTARLRDKADWNGLLWRTNSRDSTRADVFFASSVAASETAKSKSTCQLASTGSSVVAVLLTIKLRMMVGVNPRPSSMAFRSFFLWVLVTTSGCGEGAGEILTTMATVTATVSKDVGWDVLVGINVGANVGTARSLYVLSVFTE